MIPAIKIGWFGKVVIYIKKGILLGVFVCISIFLLYLIVSIEWAPVFLLLLAPFVLLAGNKWLSSYRANSEKKASIICNSLLALELVCSLLMLFNYDRYESYLAKQFIKGEVKIETRYLENYEITEPITKYSFMAADKKEMYKMDIVLGGMIALLIVAPLYSYSKSKKIIAGSTKI